jgi:bifunctional non-homologous end joining protein LigD
MPSAVATRDHHPSRATRTKPAAKKAGPVEIPKDETNVELAVGSRRVALTNLQKPFWPELGITKGDLLDYYAQIAPALVPHLKGRPFTMRRYPDGATGKAFFQKDAPKHMPEWIPTYHTLVSTRDKTRTKRWIDFPVVDDELALLWMVNMGCIDMNTWYSRIDKPERPDFVLFDLDPTPDTPWAQTVEVALILKQLLDQLSLRAFPKTSGGKGFHILVPLDRRSTYDDTRAFAEAVANAVATTHPKLATTEWSKAKRRGVLIDANQNGHGKTIASVYSVRPRPHAPVSTPLTWDELDNDFDPATFTMDVVRKRIEAQGDLYAPVLTTKQSLGRALNQLGSA